MLICCRIGVRFTRAARCRREEAPAPPSRTQTPRQRRRSKWCQTTWWRAVFSPEHLPRRRKSAALCRPTWRELSPMVMGHEGALCVLTTVSWDVGACVCACACVDVHVCLCSESVCVCLKSSQVKQICIAPQGYKYNYKLRSFFSSSPPKKKILNIKKQ